MMDIVSTPDVHNSGGKLLAGVPALLVATPLSLQVWFHNEIGMTTEGMMLQVLLFVAMWMIAGFALGTMAAHPRREALLAGGIVALAMLVQLGMYSLQWRDPSILLVGGALFVTLNMGFAALAGVLGSRVQGPTNRRHGVGNRLAGVVAMVCGLPILIFGLVIAKNALQSPDSLYPLTALLTLGVALTLLGGGLYALRLARLPS